MRVTMVMQTHLLDQSAFCNRDIHI